MKDKSISYLLEIIMNIIIGVKFAFLLFIITYNFVRGSGTKFETNVLYWKEKIEFIYIFAMVLVILYIFYPFGKNMRFLTKKMCHLIFLYGIVSLLTLNWIDLLK
jgi:hypothetical protein